MKRALPTAPTASPAARAGGASSSLGPVVRQALAWSLLNNVVARVGGLLVSIVLARILVPEEYGTFAVAFVVLAGLLSCNELGVSLAVVRWPGDPRRIASTAQWRCWRTARSRRRWRRATCA